MSTTIITPTDKEPGDQPGATTTPRSPTGILRLRAERRGKRTVLTEVYRSAPFAIGAPSYRGDGGTAEVIMQQVGPGLFPGDDLVTDIVVGPGARLVLRGQSATKVYPCPPERPARTTTRLQVEAGGWLAWLPGPLIPFRDSALRQEVTVSLAAGGRLILAELTTPGRVAMGERNRYRWLDLRCRVTVEGRIVLADRALLDPQTRPLASSARHNDIECSGALYLFGFGPLDLGPGEQGPDLWWRAGGTSDLTMVRYLGTTAQAIFNAQEAAIATAWRGCPGERPASV